MGKEKCSGRYRVDALKLDESYVEVITYGDNGDGEPGIVAYLLLRKAD